MRSVAHIRLLLLVAICVTLASLVPQVHAQAQEAITATFPENDDAPVLALTSSDPEGMDVYWDITGLDADDFLISQQGVLTFRQPPDFEAPTDREMLDDADPANVIEEGEDNEYHLVVHAIEVREEGAKRRALSSTSEVMVTVQNVNEPGAVRLDRLQPEVGSPLTATLTDEADIQGDIAWQWYTSKVTDPVPSYDYHWNAVEGEVAPTYTPRGDRVDGAVSSAEDPDSPVDEGRYLRVLASYTDGNDADKTAVGISAHPVRAEVSSRSDVGPGGNPANGSPGFPPGLNYDFSLPENSPVGTPVGRPVVAVDPNEDILTYELDDTRSDSDTLDSSGDVGAFSIDMVTGQIEVASSVLDYEARPNEPYRFFVRAIDPSGEKAEVEVSVSLTDANDPPVIGAATPGRLPESTLWVDEEVDGREYTGVSGLTSGGDAQHIFSVTDEDARGQVFLTLDGPDSETFLLADVTADNRGGGLKALLFDNPPDYEKPNDKLGHNIYRVTLVATDSTGAEARWPLTVLVNNVPQEGTIKVKSAAADQRQPEVGQWVHADLADADGEIAAITWQWSKAKSDVEGAEFQIIPGATGPSYMPTEDDSGHFLRVTATYIDSTSEPDDPSTSHLDERVQKLEGSTVTAKTAGDSDSADRLYRVTSTLVYAVSSIETDDGTPAGFAQTTYERVVSENAETGTIVGRPVRVQDHSESTSYALVGTTYPSGYFTIDRHGQIRVGAVPVPIETGDLIPAPPQETPVATTTDPDLDYEDAASYSLTVRATGDSGESETIVNIRLNDLNERPHFSRKTLEQAQTAIAVSERLNDPTVAYLEAVEPDGDGLRWELIGPDAHSFTIDDGRLSFRGRPDFEQPGSAGGTNTYEVNVLVTELSSVDDSPLKSAELPLTIEVTNGNDPGTVDFSLLQPEVGTPLTARLLDVDSPVSDEEWAWLVSKTASPSLSQSTDLTDLEAQWSRIDGAQFETYTPRGIDADTSPPAGSTVDEGRYLLARVVYTDALGADRVALAMTAYPVRPDVSEAANNAPDFGLSTITITVPESLAVGEPVGSPVHVGTNADDEVLTYDFDNRADAVPTGDTGFFTIDRATGQLSLKRPLSHEATDGRDYSVQNSPPSAGTYTLVVRATDPSGDGDTVVVKVVATDVNDAPRIQSGMSELSVHEVDSSKDESDSARYVGLGYLLEDGATSPTLDPASPNVYRVYDDDALETHTWPEPIAGPDGGLFEYSSPGNAYGRRIHFRIPPDYEAPNDSNGDNVYELTLKVVDGNGAYAEKDVRIRVLNVNEAGSLSIRPEQPVAGSPAIATLTDPDGIVTVTDWRWATSSVSVSEFPGGNVVEGATTGGYAGTAGEFLWAMVEYRDAASVDNNVVTVIDERNDDPSTPGDSVVETDFDSDEVLSVGSANAVQAAQSTSTDAVGSTVTIDLEVAENTPGTGYAGFPMAGLGVRKMIGALNNGLFVFAEDYDSRDDGYYDDTLAPVVDEDDKRDQLALMPGNHLDFEGAAGRYVLELQTGGRGGNDVGTLIVNMTVTDVNEPPSIPRRSRGLPPAMDVSPVPIPVFDMSTTTRYVAENTSPGAVVGDPVVATHPDLDEVIRYSLSGEDATYFDVGAATGQLLTREPLDYETRNIYVIDVTASDTAGATATASVTVAVTNVGLDTRYDADDSGTIDRDEIVRAIMDYFAGGPDAPSVEEILELISVYLSG